MKIKLLMIGLISLCLVGCTKEPQIVYETKIIEAKYPVITQCHRLSIPDCKPVNNGELYECTLTIQKNLNLCADQVDALIKWQIDSIDN